MTSDSLHGFTPLQPEKTPNQPEWLKTPVLVSKPSYCEYSMLSDNVRLSEIRDMNASSSAFRRLSYNSLATTWLTTPFPPPSPTQWESHFTYILWIMQPTPPHTYTLHPITPVASQGPALSGHQNNGCFQTIFSAVTKGETWHTEGRCSLTFPWDNYRRTVRKMSFSHRGTSSSERTDTWHPS